MKIVELQAENIKRLHAVDITPDSTLQIIGGKNAAGKSSVLDAIWLALGGGKASKDTPLPIREGEEKASVRLNLGDLIVTRTWTPSGTRLTVENTDGARFSSPQGMLDAIVGRLSFDPLAFTRLSPREQREALLDLVDLDVDLTSLDAQAADLYTHRTEIGRQGKAIGDVTVDDTLPTEEESATALLHEIRAGQDLAAEKRRLHLEVMDTKRAHQEIHQRIGDLEATLQALRDKARRVAKTGAALQDAHDALKVPDIAPLEERLATVEETNARVRANNAAREKWAEKARLREAYDGLTQRLTELDEQKATALATATFPVEGLSFDETGVLYEGVPLQQASSAQQIRVSLAMGMALNPKLRVLMIKDGSLLDSDSLAAIREHVAEKDFQLWLEVVDPDDPAAVIISDGQVAQ